MYKLGIDVGGTNIDYAVVDEQDRLIYGHKMLAQGNLVSALARGLKVLNQTYGFELRQTSAVHLGTTLAINSLLENKALSRVGVLRLAGHGPDFPPAYLWPKAQQEAVLVGYRNIGGGREYNNKRITPFDEQELLRAVNELLEAGAESLALVGVFSPLYSEDELAAAAVIRASFDRALPLSLSSQLGSLGFIERENTTILNAALKNILRDNFHSLMKMLRIAGYQGECFITKNNGTLFSLEEAMEFPVKTIASGPTNSLIGACKLAGCLDAVVVDIGGTSTDIGIVENGFPLYSLKGGRVAGIPCHLVAPDITALALGGGSLIRSQARGYRIGPDSVGAELFKRCQTQGGSDLTLYDIGQRLKKGYDSEALKIMTVFVQTIKDELHSLLPDPTARPILLVGGGSENIPDQFLETNYLRPVHYQIANAYGAALSEVSGQVDCIIDDYGQLNALEEEVKSLALKKGACATSLRIVEKKILPLHYLPVPKYRVLMTAAGRRRVGEE